MKTIWHPVEDSRARAVWEQQNAELAEIRVGGKKLVLVRWQEQLYCLDARCPHQGGPLGGGHVNENGEIVCPWHRFRFDVCSGSASSGGYFVNTYPVKIEDRRLWVALSKKRFWFW